MTWLVIVMLTCFRSPWPGWWCSPSEGSMTWLVMLMIPFWNDLAGDVDILLLQKCMAWLVMLMFPFFRVLWPSWWGWYSPSEGNHDLFGDLDILLLQESTTWLVTLIFPLLKGSMIWLVMLIFPLLKGSMIWLVMLIFSCCRRAWPGWLCWCSPAAGVDDLSGDVDMPLLQESMTWLVMNKPMQVTRKQRDSLKLLMQVSYLVLFLSLLSQHSFSYRIIRTSTLRFCRQLVELAKTQNLFIRSLGWAIGRAY